MTDSQNLYFIGILQQALDSSDVTVALKLAFQEIETKGKLPDYREGYKKYQDFMRVVDDYVSSEPELKNEIKFEIMESRIIDLVSGTFEGSEQEKKQILELISEKAEFLSEYERMRDELSEFLPGPAPIQVEIVRDGQSLGFYEFDEKSPTILIKDVLPGEYAIRLVTGRLLWQSELANEKLCWKDAYPKQKLPAAAETGVIRQKATITENLLGGEIRLEVFPGVESGAIVLTLTTNK